MLWPTLTVQDVDASLAFYKDILGFEIDLRLQDANGKTFLGSVEVPDTVIMLKSPSPNELLEPDHGARSGVTLTVLFPSDLDIDAFYANVRAKGLRVCNEIGDRPWGHRDFAIRDLDGYCVTLAKSSRR